MAVELLGAAALLAWASRRGPLYPERLAAELPPPGYTRQERWPVALCENALPLLVH